MSKEKKMGILKICRSGGTGFIDHNDPDLKDQIDDDSKKTAIGECSVYKVNGRLKIGQWQLDPAGEEARRDIESEEFLREIEGDIKKGWKSGVTSGGYEWCILIE